MSVTSVCFKINVDDEEKSVKERETNLTVAIYLQIMGIDPSPTPTNTQFPCLGHFRFQRYLNFEFDLCSSSSA